RYRRTVARACSARARLRHTTRRSSAYRTSTPRVLDVRAHSASSTWSATLHSRGLIGEPCGGPDGGAVRTPRRQPPCSPHPPPQLQHPPVPAPPSHLAHERVVIELPEAVTDVGIKHPLGAPVGLDPDGLKGLVGRASGPKPIACRQEVGLEDRL